LNKSNQTFWTIVIAIIVGIITQDIFAFISISFSLYILVKLIANSNKYFIFKEWVILLYSLNYLISPLLAYQYGSESQIFKMKIAYDDYFSIAIPAILCFYLGLNLIKTKVFFVNVEEMKKSTLINSKFLVNLTIISVLIRLFQSEIDNSFRFFLYLISLLRYVTSFSLFAVNPKKNWFWPSLIIGIDLFYSLLIGMYHDLLMWLIFFAIFTLVILKPSLTKKVLLFGSMAMIVLFFQAVKFSYRQQIWTEGKEANFNVVADVGLSKASTDTLLGVNNLLSMLNRGNQAWIFASTIDHMNLKKDFQGMTVINKYLESAILPRFLAPNKIESGSNEIFNEFSGYTINDKTSMGLGIFADGYVAFGKWGVYVFSFIFGLIFSLTFKLVERWTKISPFYVLLLLPLLNYAVRPDCELQTTINHLFKGILLYGFLVYLTKHRFSLSSSENQRKLLHLNLMK
jgi:hypothetical protein